MKNARHVRAVRPARGGRPVRSKPLRNKPVRWLIAVVAGAGAMITATMYGLGHYFARRVVTPALADEPLRVLAVNRRRVPHSVTFNRAPDATLIGHHYSFVFNGGAGHAKIGHILRQDAHTVERELINVDRGPLLLGMPGRMSGWWFASPNELEGKVSDLSIPGDLGGLPAWLIVPEPVDDPGSLERHRSGAFAIHVHGRGGSREETLRGVKVMLEQGFSNIVLSYRNDVEAPVSSDGRYGLGTTEWRDVESAMTEAVRLGATRIVLFGWSMGATAVLIAARESRYRHLISEIVLESPAVSWPAILDHHGKLSWLPRPARAVGARAISSGSRFTQLATGIPVADLTPEMFAATLKTRALILASEGDTFVPPDAAFELASLRPDLITLERFAIGEHVKAWNVDPPRWERAVHAFFED